MIPLILLLIVLAVIDIVVTWLRRRDVRLTRELPTQIGPVPPTDLGKAFEEMKYAMHIGRGKTFTAPPNAVTYKLKAGKMYTGDGEELVPMDRVRALTNSAFIAGSSVYDKHAERRWTYEEWEKEKGL